jgi:hypothetical protein
MDKLKEVIVKNGMQSNVWVVVAENSKHLTESKIKKVSEYDFESYYKLMVEGKASIPIEGIPIEVEGKQDQEFKLRLKQYWESNQEASFEWSGFITAGELEIPAASENKLALKGDELPYFISIRAMGGKIIADAVPRNDAVITLDVAGHIVDTVPEGEVITKKSAVYLQKKGSSEFIGDPQTANTNWDSGTIGNSAGSHHIISDSGDLRAGVAVRIVSDSHTLVDAQYKYIYSSDIGWTYYDKQRKSSSRAGKKQLWKLSKTNDASNSAGTELRYGDAVRISNLNWPKAFLGKKDSWLQCVNGDKTVWILRKEPKAPASG